MNLTTLGIDLAKTSFSLACIDQHGKGGKNDNNDAEAICEAVSRFTIWFVLVKTVEQQAQLCVHRVRQELIDERTRCVKASELLREKRQSVCGGCGLGKVF